ncbi:MAG: tripartite tricarboxylate transporter substrate binding protein BugD [Acuticoccus sp.]
MTAMLRGILALTVAYVMLAGSETARAQAQYPEKPITIIYPWAPGSAIERVLRAMGEMASEELGQPFVINNVSGAGGTKSMTAGKEAAPDGYTLLNNFVAPQIGSKLFNPDLPYSNDDFIPIANIFAFPFVVMLAQDHPANTLDEFIAWAKERGSPINYGVCAPQSVPRLVGEQLMKEAGVAYNPIPNGKGGCGGDNALGLLNGTLDAAVGDVPLLTKFDGQIKTVGMITDERHDVDPTIPTVAEQGISLGWGFASFGWGGLAVPKGTDPSIVARLQEVIGGVVQSEAFLTELGDLAPMISYVGPDDTVKLWSDSMDLLRPHVEAILSSN